MELLGTVWNCLKIILRLKDRKSSTTKIYGIIQFNYLVPQGSILGPIFFVVYINNLPQSLLELSIGMCTDDTVIYFSDSSTEIIK